MSEEKKKNQIVAGDMRPSQLIRGFGPGSIISMENDAVMILGCQAWPKKNPEESEGNIRKVTPASEELVSTELVLNKLSCF